MTKRPGTKFCGKCQRWISIMKFGNSSRNYDGLQTWCQECINKAMKKSRNKVKLEMVEAYGGKCKCCGESRIEFLTISHVNGDGAKHRKEERGIRGHMLAAKLRMAGWPPSLHGYALELLCWNCNAAMGYYGYCPHQAQTHTQHQSPS